MALTPMPGDYVRVYRSTGVDQNYADEAMQEVDRSAAKWGGQAAHQGKGQALLQLGKVEGAG